MSDRPDRSDDREIVDPADLPPQVEVSERDGITRIDIADDAETRPSEPDPPEADQAEQTRGSAR